LKLLKTIIQNLFAFVGYKLVKKPSFLFKHPECEIETDFKQIVAPVILESEQFFFLQIGSYDGVSNDYLHEYIIKFHLKGILIEPQKEIFELLRKNYISESQLILENIAITDHDGFVDLYCLAEKYHYLGGKVAQQITSLDRRHIEKCISWDSDTSEVIETRRTPCLRLDSLLTKHEVKKVDLLQIDTEGYDLEILKTIDFKTLKPTIIVYEHCHLSSEDQETSWELLRSKGYNMWIHYMDTIARLKSF